MHVSHIMSHYPFDLGIVHPVAFPQTIDGEGPILETAKSIAEDGAFVAIEVSWVKDPSVRRDLAMLLGDSRMRVVFCGGIPILRRNVDLGSLQPSARNESLDFVKQLVDEANGLGAMMFVLCSGPDPGPQKRREALSATADSVLEISDYAGEGMMVSIESFDREVDKKRLIGPTADAVDFVLALRKQRRSIGLTIDLSHLPLLKERPSTSLPLAKDVLEHAHMGNCLPDADSHPEFGAPGGCNGVPELREFLTSLESIGYFRKSPSIVSFEVKPGPTDDPRAVIARSKAALNAALGKGL